MGELLPCPFCGGDAVINQIGNEATKTRGYEVKCRTFGCSTSKRSMVVKHTLAKAREWAVERWNTRPRTEGRGEGEPVAWRVKDFADGWILCHTEAEASREAEGAGNLTQPLYASPIREPEISRTILGDPCTLEACPPGLFIADAYNTLGMKSEYRTEQGAIEAYIVESGEFFWGDNPQTVERQRAQIVRPISYADAILNLAPVAKGASQDAELSDELDRPGRLSDATRHSAEGTADPALSGARGVGEGWRPISEAPRDGTYILAHVADRDADDRWAHLAGRAFVVRHEGKTSSGYDLGWSVHPGFGGCADDWFSCWQPLPPLPQEQEDGASRADLSPASRSPDQHSAGGHD